jgi:hypothetical protein
VVQQAFTNVNGAYSFTNVAPGSYVVIETDPANTVSVAAFAIPPAVVLNANAISVTTGVGINSTGNNFLDRSTQVSPTIGSISGTVWQDLNGNGVIDAGDLPLANARVVATVNGITVAGPVFTGANGIYSFTNLPPGTYLVTQTPPANYQNVAAFAGTGGALISASTLQVTVFAGFDSGNNNFLDRLIVGPTTGSISGGVFRDANGNGIIDFGEAVIPGVTVRLLNSTGTTLLAATTTGANGFFSFTGLGPGLYRVQEIDPQGYVSLGAFPGPNAIALDANTFQVNVIAGVTSADNNFLDRLIVPPAGPNTISGFAIRDLNFNGFVNNEPGLAGMTVVLENSVGTPISSVVTDITGAFSFSGLQNGTYILVASPPGGLFSTNAIAGQGGTRLSVSSISVTTTFGITSYSGQLFLAGP